MSSAPLRIRKVGRYRKARYPSRSPAARTRRSLGRAALRAASVPAAALALGGTGCLEGPESVGRDGGSVPDADATSGAEDTRGESADVGGIDISDVALSDLLWLTETEGRAVLRAAVEEASLDDVDPCAAPTLAERLVEDQTFEIADLSGETVGSAEIDLLAPQDRIPEGGDCPQRLRPAVGFEFFADESGDDEDWYRAAEGLTSAERAALAELRTGGKAAIAVLEAAEYSYSVPRGYDPTSFRSGAEARLRAAVLELIAELRRDGFL